MSKGFTEAKAKKFTDKLVEDGEDIAESKESIVELRSAEKKEFESKQASVKEARVKQEQSEKDSRAQLDKFVKDTSEIIPGLKIPVNIKNKVIKGLTQPAGYTDDNKPLDAISNYLYKNPIEGRAKLAYILEATNGLTNMEALKDKKAKRNAMKQLEDVIKFKDDGGSLEGDSPSFESKGFDWDKWEIQ